MEVKNKKIKFTELYEHGEYKKESGEGFVIGSGEKERDGQEYYLVINGCRIFEVSKENAIIL